MIPPPPRSTLFPYTTLFRSLKDGKEEQLGASLWSTYSYSMGPWGGWGGSGYSIYPPNGSRIYAIGRSEEHTSELQSQSNLVCRLLLEKKKKNIKTKLHHNKI